MFYKSGYNWICTNSSVRTVWNTWGELWKCFFGGDTRKKKKYKYIQREREEPAFLELLNVNVKYGGKTLFAHFSKQQSLLKRKTESAIFHNNFHQSEEKKRHFIVNSRFPPPEAGWSKNVIRDWSENRTVSWCFGFGCSAYSISLGGSTEATACLRPEQTLGGRRRHQQEMRNFTWAVTSIRSFH